jgi:uncharacterized membrane protein
VFQNLYERLLDGRCSTMKTLFGKRRPVIPQAVKRNIESIAQLELEFQRQRSAVACLSDRITDFVGRPIFATTLGVWFVGWILVNTSGVFGIVPFDPYPFCFLSLCVAGQAALLSVFVLMSQKRQTRQADQWAHVALQVNLLSEQEMTKVLKLLRSVCDHLGLETVGRDRELKEMVKQTHVVALVQELEKARDANEPPTTEKDALRAA